MQVFLVDKVPTRASIRFRFVEYSWMLSPLAGLRLIKHTGESGIPFALAKIFYAIIVLL